MTEEAFPHLLDKSTNAQPRSIWEAFVSQVCRVCLVMRVRIPTVCMNRDDFRTKVLQQQVCRIAIFRLRSTPIQTIFASDRGTSTDLSKHFQHEDLASVVFCILALTNASKLTTIVGIPIQHQEGMEYNPSLRYPCFGRFFTFMLACGKPRSLAFRLP